MSAFTFVGIGWIPAILGVTMSSAAILSYVWAVLRGDVTVYVPFISEAGAEPPQSGFFSVLLFLAAGWGLVTMFVRYVTVHQMSRNLKTSVDCLNFASLLIGVFSLFGSLIVASYPVTMEKTVHNIGAYTLFFAGIWYSVFQTIITFMMFPQHNGRVVCWFRFLLCILMLVAIIFAVASQVHAEREWNSDIAGHPKAMRVPGDPGFLAFSISAFCEWIMALCFIFFFFTYIREFNKVVMQVEIKSLVSHFDDSIEEVPPLKHEREPLIAKKT